MCHSTFSGGFDGTSNVLAGKMFDIPVKGTHAHSFVTSFSTLDDVGPVSLRHAETRSQHDLLELASAWRTRVSAVVDASPEEASDGELAALLSYAVAFPAGFLALVDTYDVKRYNTKGPRHGLRTNGHPGYNSNCGTNVDIDNATDSRSAYGYSTVERTLR